MSTPINDGGPAFPGFSHTHGYGNQRLVTLPNGEIAWEAHEPGMSLRDWFAGKALDGLIHQIWGDIAPGDEARVLASHAYHIADAMLAERSKGGAK